MLKIDIKFISSNNFISEFTNLKEIFENNKGFKRFKLSKHLLLNKILFVW